MFQFIQDFDIASASYKDLYQDFLNLSVLLLQFIESHHPEEESILQIVAARSCFQHVWAFFQCMPPPILLLQQILVPEKVKYQGKKMEIIVPSIFKGLFKKSRSLQVQLDPKGELFFLFLNKNIVILLFGILTIMFRLQLNTKSDMLSFFLNCSHIFSFFSYSNDVSY